MQGGIAWGLSRAFGKSFRTTAHGARWLVRGTVLAGIALLAGTGPTKAVEIDFGALTPTNFAGCTHTVAANPGFVCANGLTFSANGSTFTASGFSNAFTTATNLTFKNTVNPPGPPPLPNTFGEGGLGENGTGPGTGCTNTDCEAIVGHSVAVVSNNAMNDIVIGSVQLNENFQI